MFHLPLSLEAWGHEYFDEVFIQEIKTIDAEQLPLQQGLQHSAYASADKLSAIILQREANETEILLKTALFYTGVIAGCSCADDPTPLDEVNEYCEALFSIDKKTALCTVLLLD